MEEIPSSSSVSVQLLMLLLPTSLRMSPRKAGRAPGLRYCGQPPLEEAGACCCCCSGDVDIDLTPESRPVDIMGMVRSPIVWTSIGADKVRWRVGGLALSSIGVVWLSQG